VENTGTITLNQWTVRWFRSAAGEEI
jgi:hypothetical protein